MPSKYFARTAHSRTKLEEERVVESYGRETDGMCWQASHEGAGHEEAGHEGAGESRDEREMDRRHDVDVQTERETTRQRPSFVRSPGVWTFPLLSRDGRLIGLVLVLLSKAQMKNGWGALEDRKWTSAAACRCLPLLYPLNQVDERLRIDKPLYTGLTH